MSLLLMIGFLTVLLELFLFPPPGGGLLEVVGRSAERGRLVTVVALLYLLVFSFSAGLLLQTFFRKTVSSEMFFFIFFIISLSVEAVRAGQLVIISYNAPAYYELVLTRVIYFGRFFGIFCLFTSGLYATGIDYQRFEIVLGISLLLAFTLAFSIPVSSQALLPTLVDPLGSSSQLLAIYFAIELFSVLNFLLAASLKRSRNYLWMALGLLLAIGGKDLLLFLASPYAGGAGALLLAAGTILFGNRTHMVYLWS